MLKKISVTLVMLLGGCATITSHSGGEHPKNLFYSGTQLDYHMLPDCVWCWLDLPVSVVGDTLMLPFDTWYYYYKPEKRASPAKPAEKVK